MGAEGQAVNGSITGVVMTSREGCGFVHCVLRGSGGWNPICCEETVLIDAFQRETLGLLTPMK
jgi:hypothetical protein